LFISPTFTDTFHRCPEWVAVLGVLSRTEIESYAARTAVLRDARHRRSQAAFPRDIPPPQPRRPIPVPRTNTNTSSHDTPSSTDSESSDSTHHRRNRNRNRASRSYMPSDINVPVSGYPNPFGQPIPAQPSNAGPPSPNWSPASSMQQPLWMANPPQDISAGGIWVPASQGGVYYPPKERERERQHSSRRHYSHHSHSGRNRERDRERDRERKPPPPQKVSRWKENLTAASIGGAAVSLLNVLTEAAEGL
jgi:hypothetical protein